MTHWFIVDKLKIGLLIINQGGADMDYIELGDVQARFADIVWENEPIRSGELVKICEKELSWKKPTTYTVLRKLCEKGLFKNVNGTVEAVVSREEYNASKSESFIEETFDGSLPAFLAAFSSRKKLSKKEIDEIQSMINEFRRG